MVIVWLRDGQALQVDGGTSVRVHTRRPTDPPTYGAGDAREVFLVCGLAGGVLREFDGSLIRHYVID
jgi:hypothetical protein